MLWRDRFQVEFIFNLFPRGEYVQVSCRRIKRSCVYSNNLNILVNIWSSIYWRPAVTFYTTQWRNCVGIFMQTSFVHGQ